MPIKNLDKEIERIRKSLPDSLIDKFEERLAVFGNEYVYYDHWNWLETQKCMDKECV